MFSDPCSLPMHAPPSPPPLPRVRETPSCISHVLSCRNNGRNTFQHHSKHVMSNLDEPLGGRVNCGCCTKGRPHRRVCVYGALSCIGSEFEKGADVVGAHSGRKAPGFEMHAKVERTAGGDLNWSAFKAWLLFLHIIWDESGTAFDLYTYKKKNFKKK